MRIPPSVEEEADGRTQRVDADDCAEGCHAAHEEAVAPRSGRVCRRTGDGPIPVHPDPEGAPLGVPDLTRVVPVLTVPFRSAQRT